MKLRLPLKLLIAYTVFIVYGTTIPFAFVPRLDYLQKKLAMVVNDTPHLPLQHDLSLPDIVSNILLFMPLGLIIIYCFKNTRNLVQRSLIVIAATLAGILLSSFVEFLQLLAPSRTPSLLDVIANGSGALGGAILSLIFRARFEEQTLQFARRRFQASPERMLFAAYAALFVIWQLAPFDVTIDVSSLKHAVKSIALTLPAAPNQLGDFAAESILFAGFSFLWLSAHTASGRFGSIVSAIFLTTLAAIGIEFSQLYIASHTTKLADMLAGLLGGIYGATAFKLVMIQTEKNDARMRRQRRKIAMCNLGIWHWLFYLLLNEWYPFRFDFDSISLAQRLNYLSWLPYVEYYAKTGVLAVLDLGQGILQYALFAGLILERRRQKQLLTDRGELIPLIVMALGLSLLLELTQLFLPERSAGITDGINSVLGVWVGYWLWQKWREQFPESRSFSSPPTHA